MPDRRDFLTWSGAALSVGASTSLSAEQAPATQAAAPPIAAAPPTLNPPPPKVGSHLGNLFSLVKQLAAGPYYSLSFLREEFKQLDVWKQRALGRVRELLYYAPAKCDPRAEVV